MTTVTNITRLPGVPPTEAIDPRLVVVKRDPFNAETPLAQQTGLITPISLFYVRSNFAIPRLDATAWRLSVEGEVARPYRLSYEELRALPSRSLLVTLECAGNGRCGLSPPTEGEPWQYGAVSTAEWTGVPLAAVLEAAGLADRTREILVEGADRGTVAARPDPIPFARSLPLDKALHPDTLLAYAMNGEPLSAQHGFQVRLIVPGWYGMASVKWVRRIAALTKPFDGFYQSKRYILARPGQEAASKPLGVIRVRSLILSPTPDSLLPIGRHRIRGLAWSGAAPVHRVEVSTDDGASWEGYRLADSANQGQASKEVIMAPHIETGQAVLVSTDWVAEHLDDPAVRLIEVDVDTAAYDSGHIRGAVGWDWRRDLQRRPVRDIPTGEEWERLLSHSGISNDTTVVLYGDNNNWFAAFAYWLFKLYGHETVRLMDGGRKKWVDEGRDFTTEQLSSPAGSYRAQEPNTDLRALRDQVAPALGQDSHALVDVRSPGEYSGELLAPENLPQEGAQRGGHIPGAANIPWATAVAGDGTFKPIEELHQIYGGKGITPDKEIIAYCRIGERSAHTWFVLRELLGYPRVRNYDGSWTEWGSLVGAPIETG